VNNIINAQGPSMDASSDDALNHRRREVLASLGAGAIAGAMGSAAPGAAAAQGKPMPGATAPAGGYNILFILTDQERFFRPGELPRDFRLAAHERLAKRGVVFENHRINSCVCTSSRSVLYTGRHIQHTKMFDNTNFPWIGSMSTDIRTIGHMLRDAGYYTAYKGKWHLHKDFETVNELGSPTKIFTKEMEEYGFSDYFGIGDIIAHDRGGYLHDQITAAMAVSWLRGKGKDLAAQNKPWYLAVNMVNPHDIMFLNTDRPGEVSQGRDLLGNIRPEPAHPLYAKQWEFELPKTFRQPLDAPGRPAAHRDFIRSHDGLVGRIAEQDEWRWRRRHNYYLNCHRDVDRNLVTLLDELDALGLTSNTIVILTADHGDLDGAHRLHAKGATSYREQNQVPLIVAHPAYAGGKRCKAVTTHLDIVPTIINLTGADRARKAALTRDLPGKDFSSLLAAPEKVAVNAVRDGALFAYNMFAYIDGDFMAKAVAMMRQPDGRAKVQAAAKEGSLRPDLTKRGAIRSVFDGRYQFTRYFSPRQHNRPTSVEALFRLNDVELYDLSNDPDEVVNLAMDRARHGELLQAMNDKLNKLIDTEVGEDVGQMLPGGIDGGWVATNAVHDV
jgi:arylsulfatase